MLATKYPARSRALAASVDEETRKLTAHMDDYAKSKLVKEEQEFERY